MWRKLLNSLPTKWEVAPKQWYEVLYTDSIKSGDNVLGETRFDPKQIVIKNGQTPKQAYGTALHEWLHAASHEFNVGLTENQVLALEKALVYAIKKGYL